MYLIYNLSAIPFIAKIALFLSYPFTYGIIFLLIIWAIFISRRKMFNFSLLFLSGFSAWFIANIFKNIFKINRPFVDLNINPLVRDVGFSFPSEHATVFMAITVSMFLINKKAGFVFLFLTILIGLSRVVIGVHYPVDIIGGFVVGIIISMIFVEIFKKI